MKRAIDAVLFSIVVSILIGTAEAAPGDPDPTFGNSGKVTSGFDLSHDNAVAVFVRNTGKIIVVGRVYTSEYRIGLSRIDPNGALDSSFGANGKVVIDLDTVEIFATAAAIQTDGKIVVVGTEQDAGTSSDFVVVRLNIDGTLDPSFSADGFTTVEFGENIGASASGVTIQPDGMIVVAGNVYDAGKQKIGLAKLSANGALVQTFWAYGIKIFEEQFSDLSAYSVAIDGDNRIFVSGSKKIGPNHYGIVRVFNSDGYLEQNLFFNAAGWLMSDPNEFGNTRFHSIAFDAAGKVVVAGQARSGDGSLDFVIARFHPDGNLDTSFNFGGYSVLFFSFGMNESANTLMIQDDGKIVAAGHANSEIALVRLTTDGLLDTSFGTGGLKTHAKGNAGVADAAIGANNKIAVVSSYGLTQDVLTMRFNSDGSLDQDFHPGSSRTSGWVLTNFGKLDHIGQAIAVQSDGKILVAVNDGQNLRLITLVRYNPDGSLDNAFGVNGKLTLGSLCSFSGSYSFDTAVDLKLRPDGKILIAGQSLGACANGRDFSVVRLNADGSTDLTFGDNGATFVDFGSDDDYLTSMAVQEDGKVILAGSTMPKNEAKYNFAVARIDTNGTLDTTFSNDGKATVTWGSLSAYAYAVGVQPAHLGGKIVVAGHNTTLSLGGPTNDFAMFRFNSNGTGDAQFGSAGRVTTDFGTDHSVINDIVLSGTKIIAVGYSGNSTTTRDFAIARYNLNGSLDTSFDTDGKVTTNFGSAAGIATSVAFQSDGKIVVAGSGRSAGSTSDDFAIARYNTNGSLDVGFSLDGKVTTNFFNFNDSANAIAIQPDGKIVVAGSTYTGVNYDLALARFVP